MQEPGEEQATHRVFRTYWIGPHNRDELREIAPGVFDNPIEPSLLDACLANPANWMCVAQYGQTVVGMVMAVVHDHPDKPTEIYLDEIGTGDDWRRRGIATILIKALCDRADANGIEEIWVGTETGNLPARELYEKSGGAGADAVYYYLDW